MNISSQTIAHKLSNHKIAKKYAPNKPAEQAKPADSVELSSTPKAPEASAQSLSKTAESSGLQAALGGLWNVGMAILNPIRDLAATGKFGLNFVRKLKTRAEEVTDKPKEVEGRLQAEELFDPYQAPMNKVNKKIQGKMTIKANMGEFYKLWEHWIDEGYGSINDRQYADVVREHSRKAANLGLLKYVPMTSVDSFTAEIVDGKMLTMTETTISKLAGLIPTSRVEWAYRRKGDPEGSNSFEQSVDRFNGDLDKVEAFYNNLFDPKNLDPNSKASVSFEVEEVDQLPALPPSEKEFEHKVHLPGAALIPTASELLSSKRDPEFVQKYGPWAVVTGASGGIGSQYAEVLAEKGLNVVLVARNEEKLKAQAAEIEAKTGVKARVVAADLTKPADIESLKRETSDIEVGMLVNNAGTWQFGSFLENDLERDIQGITLNATVPLQLTHHFGNKMAQRGKGGVVNVGSGAALHGVPGQSAYSATKGFLRNFSESLYQELKPAGVDVVVTNPGPVEGEASQAYDQSKNPLQMVTAREVVSDSLNSLGKKGSTIPGRFNKIAMGAAARMMPRDLLSSMAGFILEQAEKK